MKQDNKYVDSLEEYINDKDAAGMRFNLGEISSSQLGFYLSNGMFGTSPGGWNQMKVEIRLPGDEVLRHSIMAIPKAVKASPVMVALRATIENMENREALKKLLKAWPPLQDACLTDTSQWFDNYFYIDGKPLHQAKSWMFQLPELMKVQIKDYLGMDNEERQAILDALRNTGQNDEKPDWQKDLCLPEKASAYFGAGELYIYEKGILGHARIETDRNVVFYGDSMAPDIRQWIDRVTKSCNLANNAGFPYFTPQIDAEKRVFLNQKDGEVYEYLTMPSVDGTRMVFGHDNRRLHSGWTDATLVDITDRITNVNVIGTDRPLLRCKVDGYQQSGIPLSADDRKRLEDRMVSKELLAATYFKQQLMGFSEEKERGLKR